MEPRNFAREYSPGAEVESAMILLTKHGMTGTSFAHVLDAASAPRGSVCHHFPLARMSSSARPCDSPGSAPVTRRRNWAASPAEFPDVSTRSDRGLGHAAGGDRSVGEAGETLEVAILRAGATAIYADDQSEGTRLVRTVGWAVLERFRVGIVARPAVRAGRGETDPHRARLLQQVEDLGLQLGRIVPVVAVHLPSRTSQHQALRRTPLNHRRVG